MQTMLEMRKAGMPPSMMSQFEVHAPQASIHWKWSEGSKQKVELNMLVFHDLTRLTHLKELSSNNLFHVLRSLTQMKELCSKILVSFFKELDPGRKPCSNRLTSKRTRRRCFQEFHSWWKGNILEVRTPCLCSVMMSLCIMCWNCWGGKSPLRTKAIPTSPAGV